MTVNELINKLVEQKELGFGEAEVAIYSRTMPCQVGIADLEVEAGTVTLVSQDY